MMKLLSWVPAYVLVILVAGACAGDKPTATPTATPTLAPAGSSAVEGSQPAGGMAGEAARPATVEPTVSVSGAAATPTPSPVPTATPTPAPSPTPTATPTPLPPASDRLVEARQLHEDGNYGAARAAYAALIEDEGASSEGYEARWRLGQAYLEDGQPTEAFVALDLARREVPAEHLPPEVEFWLGEALAQVGNPIGAVEAYRRYLERENEVAGAIHLRIGRLLLEAGDQVGALAAFEQAVAAAPDNFVLFAAREELTDLFAEQGKAEAAVGQLDQILASSQFDSYRAEMQARAGEMLEQAGQTDAAMARYRQAIREAENSPDALRAANALAALGQPLADEAYARLLLANGYHADGVATMYRYFAAVPDHPAQPHLLVAESYFGQRDYALAIAEWQTLLDTHPEYTDRAGVLIRMAVAHQRLGNTGSARDFYKQAAAASTARAPAALLEAARVAERTGDCGTAAAEYLDIARLYPAAAESGEALYRAAICQYRLGQVQSAAETAQRLVAEYPTNTYAHAGRFWAGKALLEQGEESRAIDLWSGLSAEAADSYYTARAAQLAQEAGLGQLGAAGEAPGAGTAQETETLLAETEQWLAGWAAPGMEDPATLRQLPAAVAGDPQLRRGEAYLRLGLRAEAIREFDEVRERYKDDPLALYPLALHFEDLGMYRHATLAAVRLGVLAPGGLFEAPRAIQQMAYPRYFADLVDAEAAARGIDPLLIYALIRQESFFERGAFSSAAAQGLTQVIPSTAEWIADAIDWPNFQPTDIYKPYVNVKFGTYYLSAALDMFDDNPYPALVGYNAGPGNARAWLEQAATDDDDLYVEEITLSEPKLYVRRVLAHYANYLRLYGQS